MSTLRDLIVAIANILSGASKPTKIALAIPTITRKGIVMANYELKNDTVATITIQTVNSAGTVEPYPPGDVFSVTSGNAASLGAAIGKDSAGNPALVLTPLVQASPNIMVTVSDSAGLAVAKQLVDIVIDVSDTNVILDLADATTVSQSIPSEPGP